MPLLIVLMALLAFGLSLAAAAAVEGTRRRWRGVPARSGLSGRELATALLRRDGPAGARAEAAEGAERCAWRPGERLLLLRPETRARDLPACAAGVHAAGHALLGRAGRLAALLACLQSGFLWPALAASLLFWPAARLPLALAALAGTAFQVVHLLRVEWPASRRGAESLAGIGVVETPEEDRGFKELLLAESLASLGDAALGAPRRLLRRPAPS